MDNHLTTGPVISILMVNRNRGEFIAQAIESMLGQTEKNWELIIIDGASTDESMSVINRYHHDPRLRIERLANKQSIGKSRQSAAKLATAPIIGILDSDDALEKEALEIMVRAHRENPHSLIYSQFLICDTNLSPLRTGKNGPIPEGSSNLRLNRISHFATFKKSAYDQTAGYNPRLNLAEDKDIFYKLEEVSPSLFIDQVLYRYRLHRSSVSNSSLKKIVQAHFYHSLVRLSAAARRTKLKLKKVYQPQPALNLIKKVLDRLYFPFLIESAQKKLRALENRAANDEEIWEVAEKFRSGPPLRGFNLNIRPAQVPGEILTLMSKVRELRPHVILEIGTATGGTLYLWTKISPPSATIISLDLPEGPFGGGYLSARKKIMETFPKPGQTLHLIQADSHSPATRQKITALLNGRPIDFLFIDGDHRYEGAKADWENFSPLVRAGGLVALHDIAPNPQEKDSQVDRLWQELKVKYPHEEIISNPLQGWAGIGIIKL